MRVVISISYGAMNIMSFQHFLKVHFPLNFNKIFQFLTDKVSNPLS